MDEIEIVEGSAGRLDEIEPLWISLAEHHAGLVPAGLRARPAKVGWPGRRARYAEVLAGESVLLFAERSGHVVGYAVAILATGPSGLEIDPLLEIDTIAVLPEHRGGGIGNALLDAVESWADDQGFGHLEVAVRDLNVDARRLYERRGFKPLYTVLVASRADASGP